MSDTDLAPTERQYLTIADGWRPPMASRASRKISKRSSGSGRTARMINGYESLAESLGEDKVATVFTADPRIADLIDQPPPVIYRDEFGKRRSHTFDYLAMLKDGRKIAIAYRPERRAAEVREIVELIRAQAPDYADGFLVVTDADLTRDVVHNAKMIHFAQDGNKAADAKVREIIDAQHGAVSIGDVQTLAGCGGEGFRAICRLIGNGEIEIPQGARISHQTLVSKKGGHA